MKLSEFKNRFLAFWKTDSGKEISKILQYVFIVVIVGYLIYQLTEIGWDNVWQSLPVNPWFYILFFFLYFALPISEQFIYRTSWDFSFWEGFRVFIQKKIYNADVMGYSGEAYLFLWGRKNLKESNSYVLSIIKDNNIISSVTSTLVSAVLLTVFIYIGQVNIQQMIDIEFNRIYIYIGVGAVAAILASLTYFRHYIISMPFNTASRIFSIHLLRLIFVYSVEIIQWMVVMPEVPLHIWFTYMGIKIISTRIPFLPSRDLLFIGASLEISSYLSISGAGIAGILLASNVLSKLMNAILYLVINIQKRVTKYQEPSATKIES